MAERRILSAFPTFAIGGAQTRYTAIANRFTDRYDHTIISMDGITAAQERLSPGIAASFPTLDIRKGETRGNYRRFRSFLRETRPDQLITHNFGSIEWAMANWPHLVPHLHIEDGFGPDEQTTQLRRRVLIRRFVLSRAIGVVPSRNLERIATRIWRLPRQRVRYIPNGIDLSRFAPRQKEVDGLPVIGTVAALRPEKNYARLIRAFAIARRMIPARLMIVGDGAERPLLESTAAEQGVAGDVSFTGHIADPSRLFGEFDVFALSSNTEQMPISVIEAMAAALPIVSTDVGDVRYMVAEANAPFITPLDDDALASGLTNMLRDAPLRRSIGQLNRVKAEREYDQETMFQAYARLFDGAA